MLDDLQPSIELVDALEALGHTLAQSTDVLGQHIMEAVLAPNPEQRLLSELFALGRSLGAIEAELGQALARELMLSAFEAALPDEAAVPLEESTVAGWEVEPAAPPTSQSDVATEVGSLVVQVAMTVSAVQPQAMPQAMPVAAQTHAMPAGMQSQQAMPAAAQPHAVPVATQSQVMPAVAQPQAMPAATQSQVASAMPNSLPQAQFTRHILAPRQRWLEKPVRLWQPGNVGWGLLIANYDKQATVEHNPQPIFSRRLGS